MFTGWHTIIITFAPGSYIHVNAFGRWGFKFMGSFCARFLGLVLFAAGGLKGLGLAESRLGADDGLFGSRWLSMASVAIELALGLWLIVGFNPKQAGVTAIGLFAFLSIVAASKGLHGDKSCGCVGKLIEINPWFACVFDLAAVAGLWRWRPKADEKTGAQPTVQPL